MLTNLDYLIGRHVVDVKVDYNPFEEWTLVFDDGTILKFAGFGLDKDDPNQMSLEGLNQ